jgi:hypothetical protein
VQNEWLALCEHRAFLLSVCAVLLTFLLCSLLCALLLDFCDIVASTLHCSKSALNACCCLQAGMECSEMDRPVSVVGAADWLHNMSVDECAAQFAWSARRLLRD